MKMKSVSGLTCYVADLKKTSRFYSSLGFLSSSKDDNHIAFRLNWFSIDFVASKSEEKQEFKKEANAENKGAGVYFNISVEDIDGFYKEISKKGFKPASEPRNWPWGNREFALRDPDGYKLVFFEKL